MIAVEYELPVALAVYEILVCASGERPEETAFLGERFIFENG